MQIRVTSPLPDTEFWRHFRGRAIGILRWDDLDAFWSEIEISGGEWYVFDPGKDAPDAPVPEVGWKTAVKAARTLVNERRDMPVSGAVYVDDREAPTIIRIFDPRHMGSSCSHSGAPIMPRFIFSRLRPDSLPVAPPPANGLFACLRGRT